MLDCQKMSRRRGKIDRCNNIVFLIVYVKNGTSLVTMKSSKLKVD